MNHIMRYKSFNMSAFTQLMKGSQHVLEYKENNIPQENENKNEIHISKSPFDFLYLWFISPSLYLCLLSHHSPAAFQWSQP